MRVCLRKGKALRTVMTEAQKLTRCDHGCWGVVAKPHLKIESGEAETKRPCRSMKKHSMVNVDMFIG